MTVQVRVVGKVVLLYPLFKMVLGIVCGVLAVEYYAYYRGQAPGAVKVLYLGDLTVWLLAALVLISEGLREYVALVDELLKRG
ncbi:MAG: hypothetical protein ABIJ47_08015 [Candidatus Bathyarchaeota archaeon]